MNAQVAVGTNVELQGFLLRRIPPTGEWKPRPLGWRASLRIAVAFIAILAAAMPCAGEDEGDNGTIYAVQGEIASLDTVGGVIVVRWLESDPIIATNEVTLKVPEDLKIVKGADTIGLEDINQFDRVSVQYRKTKAGELPVVVEMTIKSAD
ncbi:MAG: hypothetical protein WC522_01830 [Candidatus Omnitrophota bacterium]